MELISSVPIAILSRLLLIISLHAAAVTPLTSPINVWPKPRSMTWAQPMTATLVSSNFTIFSPSHRYLSPAVSRYLRLILSEHHRPLVPPAVNLSSSSPPVDLLSVTVADLHAPLYHAVDESYNLSLAGSSATAYLRAETVWGAMRGLETFAQLVWGDLSRMPADFSVWDEPLFSHRGIMLDTSRNFYQMDDILRTIAAMSSNKLNVFHWHITDSHSFPLLLPSEPNLAGKGSYGSDMLYTPSDVSTIVQFGLEHGVRIIPEIDSPGHTGSWAEAYPEIVTCANMFWWPAGVSWNDRLASEPGTGHLNPLNPKTYEILQNVIHGVTSLFPEPFFHAGADEIVPGCWKADTTINSYLSDGGTLNQLLDKFVNTTLPYIVFLNRTAVYWEDVLLNDAVHATPTTLPPDHVILQTWNNGNDNTKRIVAAGYRVIVSSSDFYYLDCGHGDFVGNNSQYTAATGDNYNGTGGSWCGPFKTWATIYNYDIADGLSEEEAKLVLGGEVALWSEQADPSVLDARLWPRSSAMAESLWSGNRDEKGMKRYAEATDRLNEWRHRMVRRGIRAEPIQPLWCIRNRRMCNTVNSSPN